VVAVVESLMRNCGGLLFNNWNNRFCGILGPPYSGIRWLKNFL